MLSTRVSHSSCANRSRSFPRRIAEVDLPHVLCSRKSEPARVPVLSVGSTSSSLTPGVDAWSSARSLFGPLTDARSVDARSFRLRRWKHPNPPNPSIIECGVRFSPIISGRAGSRKRVVLWFPKKGSPFISQRNATGSLFPHERERAVVIAFLVPFPFSHHHRSGTSIFIIAEQTSLTDC